MYYKDYFDFHIVWTTITLGTVDNIRKGMKEMKMMSIVFMTDTADPDRGLRTNVLIFITEEPRELRERWGEQASDFTRISRGKNSYEMKYYYQNESKTKWTRIILNCIFYTNRVSSDILYN